MEQISSLSTDLNGLRNISEIGLWNTQAKPRRPLMGAFKANLQLASCTRGGKWKKFK